MLNKIAIASLALIVTAGAAAAHDTRPIDRTQAQQAYEIEKNRYTGELTRREYRALRAEQARVEQLENDAKQDGVVTRREYNAIRNAQKEAGQQIYQESHDGQKALWRRWLYRNRY